ncbi:serine/threonine protein kinase [Salipaludibacillus neizhouensis]|uniref:Serine/threonine protein kinase n=1 Tax=Salipaludibacillus neizhouensis TaxID=885475 RepID=A0A3A9K5T3_9BACI|nr:serine/threonine protein kinase [Salipaludibacillus neizhouensis]RKL65661.1 serine/threonine protein kinase [Salipaludibacillus neizhouensis]
MKSFSELAYSVKYEITGSRTRVKDKDPALELIGEGRSAFVFRINSTNKVIKVFFAPFCHLAKEEAEIYKKLIGIPSYPELYEFGANYLVIDYVDGNTLFNCLVKGIMVTSDHIKEIDSALLQAKKKGLNPSDIHLRNIMITSHGDIKIIDVARFRQTKKCSQWIDLKTGFYHYYKYRIFPKKIPAFLLNTIAFFYKKKLIHRFFIKKSNLKNKMVG